MATDVAELHWRAANGVMPVKQAAGMYCAGCGYDLAGIGACVCPECARAFDAADARTYDRRWRGSRWSRWSRRALAAGLVVMVVWAFAPRGYSEARLTFRSPGGKPVQSVRVQLVGPRWWSATTGLGYPGWVRGTSALKPSARAIEFTSSVHSFTWRGVTARGAITAKTSIVAPGTIGVNGVQVTPANAASVLRSVLPPTGGRGIRSLEADSIATESQ